MYANAWTENTCDGFCSDACYNPHVVDSAVCPLVMVYFECMSRLGIKAVGIGGGKLTTA